MKKKAPLDVDVLTAAKSRISRVFDDFERIYVSFSGGKDSTVMLALVLEEARARSRKVGLLFIDLEAQYTATVDFVLSCYEKNADIVEPYWLALPIGLRNAVSVFEPKWTCWDPSAKDKWVRQPPSVAITDEGTFPWFKRGMEFEDLIADFGEWYAHGKRTACFVGIRTDESINRFRTIASDEKETHEGLCWTTRLSENAYNAYPIYDWHVDDIWHYHAVTGAPYNKVYDLMFAAGLTPHQMRICQPYGDDQRKGLWLYHIMEPATWARVVARVAGVNGGALYVKEKGNVNGVGAVSLPESCVSYKDFAMSLLESLPPHASEHYRSKISVFIRWYEARGYPEGIPDTAPAAEEASRKAPSWRRVCKTILRNDWWCKGLGFAQHKSGAYDTYMDRMKRKRVEWNIL